MIVGPWTGELGYELLRWIPYIREKGATVAISRGGNDDWYPEGCKVLNLFDVVSPAEFRELFLKRLVETDSYKQRVVDELDRMIVERLGVVPDLHPSEMWNAKEFSVPRHQRIRKPERFPGLPDEYAALRLFKNDWLRRPPKIKRDLPIVALKTNDLVDTHVEFEYDADVVIECDIRTAIATQNRVIAHAKKLICTYGGMVYVGLMHGLPVEAHAETAYTQPWQYAQEQILINKFGGSVTRVLL